MRYIIIVALTLMAACDVPYLDVVFNAAAVLYATATLAALIVFAVMIKRSVTRLRNDPEIKQVQELRALAEEARDKNSVNTALAFFVYSFSSGVAWIGGNHILSVIIITIMVITCSKMIECMVANMAEELNELEASFKG